MVNRMERSLRARIDKNSGLISKRRLLNTLSILLLAIGFTGAQVTEANTFIFKIVFEHQNGLTMFLLIAVVVMLFRYYAYAHEYHTELFEATVSRMMKDYSFFGYSHIDETVTGLLGGAIDIWGGDEPSIQGARYRSIGFLKRCLTFKVKPYAEGEDEYDTEDILLYKFTRTWKLKDYLNVLRYELIYRFESVIKYREHLDLLGPYILGFSAILLTLLRLDIDNFLEFLAALFG